MLGLICQNLSFCNVICNLASIANLPYKNILEDLMSKDIKAKRIYHSVPGSNKGEIHNMEYNIVLGWMCSCKSYMYRKSCKHVVMMNEMMNEHGACADGCKHLERHQEHCLCLLWEITVDEPERFNCAGWDKR